MAHDFTFLHAADIHLDSPLRALEQYPGAPVDALRNASRQAFDNLVDLALREGVAFVLIAGDLFDGDWKDYRTGLYMNRQLARLCAAGIRVFLVSGNHDAASAVSRTLTWPPGVRAFPWDAPGTERIHDLNVAIHGQGFPHPAVTENLAVKYPAALPGWFNIGVLHTAAAGAPGHAPYAPCTVEDLLARQYDYWALGHVHRRQVLHENPWIVYPGNVQGRHIREPGAGGCTLVSVRDARVHTVEHRDLDVLRWTLCATDVSEAQTAAHALDLAAADLEQALQSACARPVAARVILSGATPAHAELAADPDRWINELRGRATSLSGERIWIEKVRFETAPPVDEDALREQGGPVAALLDVLDFLERDPGAAAEDLAPLARRLRAALPPEALDEDDALALESPGALSRAVRDARRMLLAEIADGGAHA